MIIAYSSFTYEFTARCIKKSLTLEGLAFCPGSVA